VRAVDRYAIARRRRREQALEQLEFEREREAALLDQLEDVVAAPLAAEVDEAAFAGMSPEDVAVVREAFDPGFDADADSEFGEELLDWTDPEPEGDEADELEAEILRLQAAVDDSRRRQQAYERYLEALEP
jgi:hypothetical protein